MEFDLTKEAKKAIQNVVNNTLYRGKPIIDWINFIANNADDLISRQVLKQAMYHETFEVDSEMQKWDGECWIRYKLLEKIVDSMPSVQPAQKTGRWIFEKGDGETCVDGYICSACGRGYHTKVPYFSEFDFCPCCGAKMESEE